MRWTEGRFIATWPEPDGQVVYFVTACGMTKIGWATSLRRRMRELAVGCPVPLLLEGYVPGGSTLELCLHHHFVGLRAHGEWFRRGRELQGYLRRLASVGHEIEALRAFREETFLLPRRNFRRAA